MLALVDRLWEELTARAAEVDEDGRDEDGRDEDGRDEDGRDDREDAW